MNRKEFITTCGASCLGLMGINLVQSCRPAKQVHASVKDKQLIIEKKEFEIVKAKGISYHRSLVTKPAGSDYPIVIYRFSETAYSALLLRCTHQNSELNLNGDIMTCSAHGSEFNTSGEVIQGPAEQRLQAFKVTSDDTHLYIQLT